MSNFAVQNFDYAYAFDVFLLSEHRRAHFQIWLDTAGTTYKRLIGKTALTDKPSKDAVLVDGAWEPAVGHSRLLGVAFALVARISSITLNNCDCALLLCSRGSSKRRSSNEFR